MNIKKKFNLSLLKINFVPFLIALFLIMLSSFSWAAEVQTTTIPTPQPSNLPIVTDAEIIALAKDTALSIFNYDYQNYQSKLQAVSKNFTVEGWQKFTKALNDSKNLLAMQQYRLTMSGQITGEAKIIKRGMLNNQPWWGILIPMEVIFTTGDNKKIVHNYLVKVGISSTDKTSHANGIAVTQIIAGPRKK